MILPLLWILVKQLSQKEWPQTMRSLGTKAYSSKEFLQWWQFIRYYNKFKQDVRYQGVQKRIGPFNHRAEPVRAEPAQADAGEVLGHVGEHHREDRRDG